MQLWEYENQSLEAFVAVTHSYAKFDCPLALQNISFLATVHDCETGLFENTAQCWLYLLELLNSSLLKASLYNLMDDGMVWETQ